MQIKIHDSYRKIVAISDSDLIGKKFEEGIMQIDIKQNFFSGDEKTNEELIEILQDMQKEDATFNIVGQQSINCALKAGVIKSEGVFKIQGIPIALVLL
jgi:hypothetical protein